MVQGGGPWRVLRARDDMQGCAQQHTQLLGLGWTTTRGLRGSRGSTAGGGSLMSHAGAAVCLCHGPACAGAEPGSVGKLELGSGSMCAYRCNYTVVRM